MRISLIVVSLILSGCANAPKWLAEAYDSQDPCQQRNYYKQGGQEPRYCGAGSGGTWVYRGSNSSPPAAYYIKK